MKGKKLFKAIRWEVRELNTICLYTKYSIKCLLFSTMTHFRPIDRRFFELILSFIYMITTYDVWFDTILTKMHSQPLEWNTNISWQWQIKANNITLTLIHFVFALSMEIRWILINMTNSYVLSSWYPDLIPSVWYVNANFWFFYWQ